MEKEEKSRTKFLPEELYNILKREYGISRNYEETGCLLSLIKFTEKEREVEFNPEFEKKYPFKNDALAIYDYIDDLKRVREGRPMTKPLNQTHKRGQDGQLLFYFAEI